MSPDNGVLSHKNISTYSKYTSLLWSTGNQRNLSDSFGNMEFNDTGVSSST